MSQRKRKQAGKLGAGPVVVGIGILALVGVGLLIMHLMKGAELPGKRKEVVIQLVQPPPPPPPPPKPVEPPPPEQKMEEPKPQEEPKPEPEPEPKAEEAPPVVSEGPAGNDAFGMRGGKNVAGIPGKIGGGGDRNRWYAGVVQRQLQALLEGHDATRAAKYSVILKIWVSKEGRLERFEFASSTGNPEVDSALRTALQGSPPLGDTPPESMPQPLRLRVVSR